MIITTTSPTPTGEMLWRVQYSSSYYDSDPRGSSTVPIGAVAFVLARSREEAITKAVSLPGFDATRRQKDKGAAEETEAHIATLEELIPSEDARRLHRGSGFLMERLREVKMAHPDDQTRYRLAVCLVPVK